MAVAIAWTVTWYFGAIPFICAARYMQRRDDTISALFMCALAAMLIFMGSLPLLVGI